MNLVQCLMTMEHRIHPWCSYTFIHCIKIKGDGEYKFSVFYLDAKGTEAENARLFPNNVVVKSWH